MCVCGWGEEHTLEQFVTTYTYRQRTKCVRSTKQNLLSARLLRSAFDARHRSRRLCSRFAPCQCLCMCVCECVRVRTEQSHDHDHGKRLCARALTSAPPTVATIAPVATTLMILEHFMRTSAKRACGSGVHVKTGMRIMLFSEMEMRASDAAARSCARASERACECASARVCVCWWDVRENWFLVRARAAAES